MLHLKLVLLVQINFIRFVLWDHVNKGTQGNSRELKGTQGNSRELKGTQGNSRELKGSARRSNRRKKTQIKGQRGEISQIREREKRKHRSALRALKNEMNTFQIGENKMLTNYRHF